MSQILHGDGSFKFVALVEGSDLVVDNVVCTWFGGDDDPQDNGLTASGVVTKGHPHLMGCALPMDSFHHAATNGSPIPRLAWKTLVTVTNRANGLTHSFELIDLGPSKSAPSHAAIDLTKAAFQALGGQPSVGIMKVDYRIVGGAKAVHGEVHSVSLKTSSAAALFDSSGAADGNVAAGSIAAGNAAAEGVASEPSLTLTDPQAITDAPGEDFLLPDRGHGSANPHAKPVIKQFIQSPNFSSRNGVKINTIVLHCTESATAQGAINEFLNPGGRQVSAHYIVDLNGDIYQMVRDADRANHCRGANGKSIGIEHAGRGNKPLTAAQQAATVKLITWLMAQYDIPHEHIYGHDFTPGYSGGGTSCPDALFGTPHSQKTIQEWLAQHL